MSSRRDARKVDALAALARDAAPPPISEARRDSMISRALSEAEDRAVLGPSRSRRPSPAWIVAAAAVIALAFVATRPGEPEGLGEGVLVLATGDRVTTAPHAALELEEVTPESRVIAVRGGEALFDVRPLDEGESFVVRTPELEVAVRGTVFAVERAGEHTTVRVYEGRVDVRERGETTSITPGDTYRSGTGRTRDVQDGALAELGRAAAARRSAEPTARTPQPARSPQRDPTTQPEPTQPEPTTEPEPTLDQPTVARAEPARDRTRPEPTSERALQPHAEPTPEPPPSISDVQSLVATRRFAEALDAARAARARAPGEWRYGMLEAQALQGLGRAADAADAYDALARTAPPAQRPEAAFRAATLRWRELGDPRAAVASLDAAEFTHSALEERALGLRARALAAAGDPAARDAARAYLARYPEGGLADVMHELAAP